LRVYRAGRVKMAPATMAPDVPPMLVRITFSSRVERRR
jgi:hypothetical protein